MNVSKIIYNNCGGEIEIGEKSSTRVESFPHGHPVKNSRASLVRLSAGFPLNLLGAYVWAGFKF